MDINHQFTDWKMPFPKNKWHYNAINISKYIIYNMNTLINIIHLSYNIIKIKPLTSLFLFFWLFFLYPYSHGRPATKALGGCRGIILELQGLRGVLLRVLPELQGRVGDGAVPELFATRREMTRGGTVVGGERWGGWGFRLGFENGLRYL